MTADPIAVITDLADRYEHLAATTHPYIGTWRARHIAQTAADIRTVLATGCLPGYLLAAGERAGGEGGDAPPDVHGAPSGGRSGVRRPSGGPGLS
ncbi:hypothetical protein [Streptomyces turgidiscabies]|uniref:hypothetical protein n=1 Tax=Streptomyces turgidiscabies TaxID=85558 RepID=UPI0038F8081F